VKEWIAIILDLYICIILTVEYLWGRSDTDLKNEAKKKSKIRRDRHFEELNVGEGR
jgi:hypothetical protein